MKPEQSKTFHDLFRTSRGWAGAVYSARGLRFLVLPRARRREAERALAALPVPAGPNRPWPLWRRQLGDYFDGKGPALSLPLDLSAPGDFTGRVWKRVRRIPYGRTLTYGEVARRVGCPGGARAVGQAMKMNPVPVFVPCHRVVAAGGIGGFSGGIPKADLLDLEAGRGSRGKRKTR